MAVTRFFDPKLRAVVNTPFEPRWLTQHPRRDYIVATLLSTPPWLPRWKLQLLHVWKHLKTNDTGVPHVLDHDVPLCHPHVSGLTVPWNIRIVPWAVNASKGNRFAPDQLELPL